MSNGQLQQCARSHVQAALKYGADPPGYREKHQRLGPDSETQVLSWILENARESTQVTRKEIKDHSVTEFRTSITRGRVNSCLRRHADHLVQLQSTLKKSKVSQIPGTTQPVLARLKERERPQYGFARSSSV
jgi:hypothetical protein